MHYLRGELDEALRVFQQQVDALESSDHALKERTLIELDCKIGATYLRMKRTADADRHFSRAVKTFDRRLARGADDPFTKYYMAALYALKGETDRALRYLGRYDSAPTGVESHPGPDGPGFRCGPHGPPLHCLGRRPLVVF